MSVRREATNLHIGWDVTPVGALGRSAIGDVFLFVQDATGPSLAPLTPGLPVAVPEPVSPVTEATVVAVPVEPAAARDGPSQRRAPPRAASIMRVEAGGSTR